MTAADARYTFRSIARRPGFSLAVIGIIALSIGSCTAIFSLVKTILLTSLPYVWPFMAAFILIISFGLALTARYRVGWKSV